MKLSADLLAITLSAPTGVISPAAAVELTRTELKPAQATAAAELLLKALKERQGDAMHDAPAAQVLASIDEKTVQAPWTNA